MPVRMVCMSHSPLMLVPELRPRDREAERGFYAALRERAAELRRWKPQLAILFAPDHFNGFFHDLMPPFCIGTEAESTRDWKIPRRKLRVDTVLAERCVDFVRARGVDVAISRRMKADHGFTISMIKLFGSIGGASVLPVFVNCAAHPRPSFKRVRQLGEAVGAFAASLPLRTVVIGSGGLSHDPPTPRLNAPKKILDRLIDRHTPSDEQYRQREARVIGNAKELAAGFGPLKAPDRDWDRRFLERASAMRLEAFDRYTDAEIDAKAGFGGHEVRVWVAAHAAMRAAGRARPKVDFYRVIPEWITGMAVAHAP
ncbi:MAG: 3-carboxyethylcatechol 2,3-dioxygenase [Betaproteobacteria bacterium]